MVGEELRVGRRKLICTVNTVRVRDEEGGEWDETEEKEEERVNKRKSRMDNEEEETLKGEEEGMKE